MADEVAESIAAALLDMSAVTDLVGTGDDAKIYDWLKQGYVPPAAGIIVIEIDANTEMNDLQGLGGLVYYDVNILCRAPTQSAVMALARAVKTNGTDPGTGLAGYSDTPSDVLIDAHLIDTTGPTAVTRDDGSANPWWDANMSFTVSQNEVA